MELLDRRTAARSLGDALALYSDGITESANDDDKGEEFGEPRLIEGLERHRELPAEALLASVVDEVRQFSSGDQQDDITLIAKCRQVLRRSFVNFPATQAESLYSPRLDHRAA
jgi:serine phosphatase RsbU (regulator of sigma subunit)